MMNERIRELAMKVDPELAKETIYCTSTDLEKFAESIVGECLGIVEDAVLHREPASTYVGKIKQHFGVEE